MKKPFVSLIFSFFLLSALAINSIDGDWLIEIKKFISTEKKVKKTESTQLDFFSITTVDCSELQIDIGSGLMTPCETVTFGVSYCNNANEDATDVLIEIELDPIYNNISGNASLSIFNNQISLDVGTLAAFQCAHFEFTAIVSCDAIPDKTYCSEAVIFSDCDSETPSGIEIEASIDCVLDGLIFTLLNTGNSTWNDISAIIIQDDLIFMQVQDDTFYLPQAIIIQDDLIFMHGNFDSIPATDSLKFFIPLDTDKFFQLELEGLPHLNNLPVWIEGCNPEVGTGFPLQYMSNDPVSTISTECREIDFYDNGLLADSELLARPKGFGPPHYIEPNVGIEYKIIFEIEGDANEVIINDYLPPYLDENEVFPGASSHPYIFTQTGNNLTFLMQNIQANEEYGFVQFYVEQIPDNPPGTVILNNATVQVDTIDLPPMSYFHTIIEELPTVLPINNFALTSLTPKNLNVCGGKDTITITVFNENNQAMADLEVHPIFPNNGNGLVATDLLPHLGVDWLNATNGVAPIFMIDTIGARDSLMFQFLVEADCALIEFAQNNPITIDFNLTWNGNFLTLATHNSTDNPLNAPINLFVPNLILDDFIKQSYEGVIGETFNRELIISNSAAESIVEEFYILHSKETGLELNSISVGEKYDAADYFGDPTYENYWLYLIGAEDIMNFGDEDEFLEEGETLKLTEKITISGCENLNSEYSLHWGCGANFCDTTEFGADITLANGTPVIDIQTTVTPEDYNVCAGPDHPFHIKYTIINNGTEDLPGAGTAYFDQIHLGSGITSGAISPFSITYFNWDNFKINGYAAPVEFVKFTNAAYIPNGYWFNFEPDSFHVDIDSLGALMDQNGDGFFFDLAVDDTLVIEFDVWRVCDSLLGVGAYHGAPYYYPEELECTNSFGARAGGGRFFYESQCGEEFSENSASIVSSYRRKHGTALLDFPSDAYHNDPFNISYRVGEFFQNIEMCADDSMFVEVMIPAGFSIVEDSIYMIKRFDGSKFATQDDTHYPVEYIEVNNDFAKILLKTNRPSPIGNQEDIWQYDVNIQLVYEEPTVNCISSVAIIDLFSYSTCDSCSGCISQWNKDCQEIVIQTHNDVGCDSSFPGGGFGIKTFDFTLERINYDPWQDHLLTIPTDPNTYNKKAGIPGDTIRVSFPAKFLGDASVGYDSIMVEICYEEAIRERWLNFLEGDILFESSDGIISNQYAFDIPPIETGTEVDWDHFNYCYLFNISTAIPNNIMPQNGDSLWITLDFEILPQEQISQLVYGGSGGRDLIDDWSGHTYLMKNDTVFSTDTYGNIFEFNQSLLVGNGQAPIDLSGCATFGWDFGANQSWTMSNGSALLFPYEFRQEAIHDSIVITVPETWIVKNDSFVLKTRVTAENLDGTGGTIATYQTISPDTFFVDGKMKLVFRNGKDSVVWQPFEVFSENVWKQAINVQFEPTCLTTDTENTPEAYSYINNFPVEIMDAYATTRQVNYTPPVFELGTPQTIQNPETEIVCWDLVLDNLNNITSNNNWLAFENSSNNIGFISLIETTNNGSDSIPLIEYGNQSNAAVWAKLGTLAATEKRTFKICADYQNCALDSIEVFQSYACTNYPNSPQDTECKNGVTTLKIEPIPAELQIELMETPTMPVDLCEEMTYEVKISNINFGQARKLQLETLLPTSTLEYIEGTSEMAFPSTSNLALIDDPILENNRLKWSLSESMNSPLWGYNHADSSEIRIRFKLKTGCPFVSGDILTFFANAENNCGSIEEAIAYSPEPITINGLESSGTSFGISILEKEHITPCADPSLLKIQLKNTGNAASIGNERLTLTFPDAIDWSSIEPQIIIGENWIEDTLMYLVDSTTQELSWNLKAGFSPNDTLILDLYWQTMTEEFHCSEFDFELGIKEFTEVSCIDGGSCEVENVLYDLTETVAVELGDISISNISLNAFPQGSDSVSLTYQFDLLNTGGTVTENHLIYFYHENELLYIDTVAADLLNGATTLHSGYFDAHFSDVAPLQIEIDGCMCNNPAIETVFPTFYTNTQIDLCTGDFYEFNGDTIFTEGTYNQMITNPNGVDTALSVTIQLLDTFYIIEPINICAGEVFDFNSETYFETGFYCQNFTSTNGCDSTHCFDLTVLDTFFTSETIEICANEEYYFNNDILKTAGTYCQKFTALSNGCDSTHCIELIVLDTTHTIENIEICAGEVYEFNNTDYFETGFYCDTFPSIITGCDSIVCLDLTVLDTFYNSEIIEICSGEVYEFNNAAYSETGFYCDTFPSIITGCDSIVCLDLTVLDTFYNSEIIEICAGEVYEFNNVAYSDTGFYCDTFPSIITGCDSIVCLDLMVLDTFYNSEIIEICLGEVYEFNNVDYSETGFYCDTFLSIITGCDSIVCLDLMVLDTFNTTETIEICGNETYDFNGDLLSESGIYHDTIASLLNGCDSIHTLNLIVFEEIITDSILEYCESDSIQWRDSLLTISGTYLFEEFGIASNGCDSVHLTEITIHPDPIAHILTEERILWLGESVEIEIVEAADYNYFWQPSESLTCDDCPNPIANPTQDISYLLLVTDLNDCTALDTLPFQVNNCRDANILVPNTVTPNDDGVNDTFWIYEQDGLAELEFIRIWNRWGNLVFETNDLNEHWDARYKGDIVGKDVFVYHIKGQCLEGEIFEMRGNITVIR